MMKKNDKLSFEMKFPFASMICISIQIFVNFMENSKRVLNCQNIHYTLMGMNALFISAPVVSLDRDTTNAHI